MTEEWTIKLWRHRNDKRPYWVVQHKCEGITPLILLSDAVECLQCGKSIPYSIIFETNQKNKELGNLFKLQGI